MRVIKYQQGNVFHVETRLGKVSELRMQIFLFMNRLSHRDPPLSIQQQERFSIAQISLSCFDLAITKHERISHHATKKPALEYPTAGAGISVKFYSDRGKGFGPVFSSVEKAQGYLSFNFLKTQL